jgi:menaquinone-dependent protoporphyrinogen oxidase
MNHTQPASERDSKGQPTTAALAPTRVLVAYASRHGSTAEVADAIGAELRRSGADVSVQRITGRLRAEGYDAVVLGGPMIMGWHRHAAHFLKRNAASLAAGPLACFITAASLTQTNEESIDGVPIFYDPWLAKAAAHTGRLGLRERYTSPRHYLKPITSLAPRLRPVSVAFFGGSLDLTRMSILEKLFVMLIVGASPGDLRNWDAITSWAGDTLPGLLGS